MVGIVVVTHAGIGAEMVRAAQRIIPEAAHMKAVSVDSDSPPSVLREEVHAAVGHVRSDDGVLILTDMFGGTPSNICLSLLDEQTEVISGVNMPMLIKLGSMRTGMSFREMVTFIQKYGQRNIVVASHVLTNHGEKEA